MRGALLGLFVVSSTACGAAAARPRPIMATLPAPAPMPGALGPMSTAFAEPPPDHWQVRAERSRAREASYVSARQLADDEAELRAILAALPVATAAATERARGWDDLTALQALAPYPLDATANALMGSRLGLCVRYPDELHGCFTPTTAAAPAATAPPATLTRAGAGDALLLMTVADFDALPAMPTSDAELPPLILDLRQARGRDPRPAMPWLRALVGEAAAAPLRAIDEPAALRPYVEAYRATFADDARPEAPWRALVRTGPPPAPPVAPPLPAGVTVVVGPGCEEACELVARVLQTYAGATVLGNPGAGHRLGRDDAAMARLPGTGLLAFFHATSYRLAPEIEAATGPSDAWHATTAPALVDDGALARVITLVELGRDQPAALTGCTPPAATASLRSAPPELRAKVHGSLFERSLVRVRLAVPQATFVAWAKACVPTTRWAYWLPDSLILPATPADDAVLTALAGSPLVTGLDIEYDAPVSID